MGREKFKKNILLLCIWAEIDMKYEVWDGANNGKNILDNSNNKWNWKIFQNSENCVSGVNSNLTKI